jgi:hypothetical protein
MVSTHRYMFAGNALTPMKTLSQFFQHLIRKPPTKPPARPDQDTKAVSQPSPDPPEGGRDTFANENSPPGYKIRWRH